MLILMQCMEVSGSLLATIGAAPGSMSAELGQRWLGQVDVMLDAPLEGGEDQCVSCVLEIIRTERGLDVLKPMWPRVIVGLGTRIASTNDVARAGAINVLTQWINGPPHALPLTLSSAFFSSSCKSHLRSLSRRRVISRARPAHPSVGPANAPPH